MAKDNEFRAQGLRILDVNVQHHEFGRVTYDGVWTASSSQATVLHNQSFGNLVNLWRFLNTQNLRLIDVEAYREEGEVKFMGVWRSGTGGSALFGYMTQSGLIARWQELAQQNLRLISVDSYFDSRISNEVLYVAAWRSGTEGYALWFDPSLDGFRAKVQEFAQQNLYLVDVDITPTELWVGVFLEQSPKQQRLFVTHSQENFEAEWRNMLNSGWRLIDFATDS